MAYLIGVGLAVFVSLLGRFAGLDRDRSFYTTITIVVASYYCLFAVMGGSMRALTLEAAVMLAFLVAALLGFKRSLWIVAGALFAHGVFDVFHGHLINNPGLPPWWPKFCLTYDLTASGCLAWLLATARGAPKVGSESNGSDL